jgi:hypothetical protein
MLVQLSKNLGSVSAHIPALYFQDNFWSLSAMPLLKPYIIHFESAAAITVLSIYFL